MGKWQKLQFVRLASKVSLNMLKCQTKLTSQVRTKTEISVQSLLTNGLGPCG